MSSREAATTDKENDRSHQFCVTATYAKQHWFLETSDLACLEHEADHRGWFGGGGSFKYFTPASLDQAALKKWGPGGVERKREQRIAFYDRKRKREEEKARKAEEERQRKAKWAKEQRIKKAKPVRPQKAATLYYKHYVEELRSANPGVKAPELKKISTGRFKALSEDELNMWKAKEVADRHRYNQELAAWKAKYF